MACVFAAILAGLALALASPDVRSRTVLDLDMLAQPVGLQDWGDYWIDTSGSLTAQQIANDGAIAWQATSTKLIYPVTSGQAVWIRLNVPPAPDVERWYLEVPYAALDRASLYTPDDAGRWNEQRAGDLTAVSQWPVPHRHPLLPIALSAEVPTKYLLRLENGHAFNAALRFISEGRLSYSEQRVSLILGIFFGLTGLAALISALGAVSLRDSAHALYALCVVLMALTQACITGIAGLHLWPDWPWWNDISSTVLPMLTVAATLLFLSAAVALPERSRRLHLLIKGLAAAGLAAAVGLAWVPAASRMELVIPALLVLEFSGIFTLVWTWRRGDRFAPWLLLSYLPVLLAASLTLASSGGLLATGFLTQYGMQIAVALNLPVVMVVLMLRSQHRRENIRRIQGLDRIDPSTGLINGHVFSERLLRMIARSDRLHHQSAVMLIDVINTEKVQRDFGRKAADELPLRVAQVHVVYALVPHRRVGAEDILTQLEERLATIPARSRRKVFMLGEVLQPSLSRRAPLAEAA